MPKVPVRVAVPADMSRTVAVFLARYAELQRYEASWRSRAACLSPRANLRWFFPDTTHQVVGAGGLRKARHTCASCPVRRPCLGVALGGRHDGVWAGTTAAEREEVAQLPIAEQVRLLESLAEERATAGPWRVTSEREWEGAACPA